jgi:hypothetical protein
VAHFQRAMMMDIDQAAKAMRDEEMAQEIEDFIEGCNQHTYRGMPLNGHWVATWSSGMDGLGIAAPMRSGYTEPLWYPASLHFAFAAERRSAMWLLMKLLKQTHPNTPWRG